MTETLEPTADARIAPSRVLRRHADHQRGEIRLGARATTASCLRAIVFLGHQRPIPAQDGVRCDDTRDGRQSAPAKNLAFHGQAAALVVGDVEPSRSVHGAEDSVLLEQVVNNCLLLSVDPAGDEENNEHERSRQRVHGASVPERLAQCKARRDCSIGRHTSRPLKLPGCLRRAHTLTPPSASDRALDSATASDTNGHSPAQRPQPGSGPAYTPSVPHERDDHCSNAGTQGASAPDWWPSRRACNPTIPVDGSEQGTRRSQRTRPAID